MQRVLDALKEECLECSKCNISRQSDFDFDPHVLSNLSPSPIMIVGQNPGRNECLKQEPFVGQAGLNFFKEIAKYGLGRKDFYITNTVKCFTPKNRKPTQTELSACRDFFVKELGIIKPKLIITLGEFSFSALVKDSGYKDGLGELHKTIIDGEEYSIFCLYHPSPMNLCVSERREKFNADIKKVSEIILTLKPN